jgi:tripartite-type tricarboxylate transporter receptor subunit TctC
MIVPFAPGGNTDIIARVFAPKMSEILGQQLIIENRGGAGSTIGTEAAARAAPDGYVLLMVSAAHTINPAMIRKMSYDSVKGLHRARRGCRCPDCTRRASIAPGAQRQGPHSTCTGAAEHTQLLHGRTRHGGSSFAELLASIAKIKLTPIHYKSSGQSLIDVISGICHFQFPSMPSGLQHTRSGKLRMIGQTGEKRSPEAKDIPTLQEQG